MIWLKKTLINVKRYRQETVYISNADVQPRFKFLRIITPKNLNFVTSDM